MSTHIASDVWKYSRAHGAALLVLVSLADQANDAGECWPSVESIAARCRVSVRSVHRYLDQLVALGELEKVQRLGRSSAYVVHPLGDALTPANLADPSTSANLADRSANLTEAPANLADLTPANLADGSATAGRQNRHLNKNQERPSSSTTADAAPDKDAPGSREDVDQLCEHLASRIEANGSRRPTITKTWRTEARLLLDRDQRPIVKAHKLIDWCQDDSFWRANVRSMPTFREQYDALRLRAIEQWEREKNQQPAQRLQPVPAYAETPALPPDALPWQQQTQEAS